MNDNSKETDMTMTDDFFAAPHRDDGPGVGLTRRQIELRDETGFDLPKRSEARERNIQRVRNDLASCSDFIADLDRVDLAAAVAGCERRDTPVVVANLVADLRKRAVAKGRALRHDLSTLENN